jgi:hypothetical protein
MKTSIEALFERLKELEIDPDDDYWTLEMSPDFATKFVIETGSPDSPLDCVEVGPTSMCCYKDSKPWFNFEINERVPEGQSFLIQTWKPSQA